MVSFEASKFGRFAAGGVKFEVGETEEGLIAVSRAPQQGFDAGSELARSEICPFQVIRLADKPVYGTQFHSEMDEERLRERILVFLDDYVADESTHRKILWRLRPSIEADRLLELFLERYA